MPDTQVTEMDPVEFMRSKAFVVVLVLSVIVGVIVSFLSWAFLEAVYQVGQLYYDHLPSSLGFDTVPVWWCLPALFIAGFITAFAIDLCDQLGLATPTPRDAARRGAHVAVQHLRAREVVTELTARHVIFDFREPNIIRAGCSPLTTRFVDVYDGLQAVAALG